MIGSGRSRYSKQTAHVAADAISSGHNGRFWIDCPGFVTMKIVKNAEAPILLSARLRTLGTAYSMISHSSKAFNLVGFAALSGTLGPRPSSMRKN